MNASGSWSLKAWGGPPARKDVAMRWTWVAVLALMAGCDGIDLDKIVRQHETLTRVAQEPAGDHCHDGGRAHLAGPDLDDDGTLDDTEVTSTTYDCDVPVSIPGVLVRTRAVPPGEKCAHGGQVSHAGLDTNGDGLLDDGEVTREVYACTEKAPIVVRLTSIPPLKNFCVKAGTEVEAGQDLDLDGELDDGEVQAYTRLCQNKLVVLARQRPEPAGAACAMAGTAVLAGVDSNGDGTLTEDEAHETLYLCEPARTFDGLYELEVVEDLVALQGVSHIRGGLSIRGNSLQEVVLPALVSVDGPLSIQSSRSLVRVSLPSLRSVGGALAVAGNSLLETLELGGTDGQRLAVATDLTVSYNDRLRTLSGLRLASPTRHFTVNGNALLETFGSFDHLTLLTGMFTVVGNSALQHLYAPALMLVSMDLNIADNPALTTLGPLSNLRSVGQELVIDNNDALVDLSGMPALQSVGTTLRVQDNDALKNTSGLGNLRQVGQLTIFENAQLEMVGDLPLLESIDLALVVERNPKLVTMGNLHMLTRVGLLVSIADAPLLTKLNGLDQLPHLKQLNVANTALTSLRALSGLRGLDDLTVQGNAELTQLELTGLTDITTRFTVADNPKLPGCLASALAEAAYKGKADDYFVKGNDDTATCAP